MKLNAQMAQILSEADYMKVQAACVLGWLS
jgi:hypothetical protein